MDYTIIGSEANLAARLQSTAEPGEVVVSYETFMLVSGIVRGRAREPLTLKGIGRQVVPYVVEAADEAGETEQPVVTEHTPGLDLFLDVRAVTPASSERAARALEAALAALKGERPAAATATERENAA
jgi:hypothetical protein